ncbi:MAG: PAS domain S-box protein, partial [Cytophagaceae bacterium]
IMQGYLVPPAPTLPPTSTLLDQLQLAYVLLDRQGLLVEVNDTLLRLTGYTSAEVLGQSYHEVFSPLGQREQRQQELLHVLREQTAEPYYEHDLLARDGQLVRLQWQQQLLRDADGQVTGIWAAGHQLRAVKEIPGSNTAAEPAYLQEFFNDSHDLILHLRADNSFLFINKAGEETLGYQASELASRSLADIVHPYYRAKLLHQLRRLYEGQALNKLETVLMTRTGRPVHLIGSVSCVRGAGQPLSARVVLHDITDRIKAERLQKVYYSIANLAISARDLPALYGAIHRELSKILETNNLYIALCDDQRTMLRFAYHIDQYPQLNSGASRPFSTGVSEYVIQQGQPRYFSRADLLALMHNGTITAFGRLPEVMLVAPLSVGERTIGVLAVQDYDRADTYAPSDLDILHFISSQVALAIDRKSQEEHLARQNARLNAIFESGTHLLWSVTRQGNLVSFNRNYADNYFRRNGILPTPGINLFETERVTTAAETHDIIAAHYRLALQGQPQQFEVNTPDALGRPLWASVSLNPIYLPDGSFEEVSARAQDITESKNSQLALAAQEEKFRSIFESFQDIYYRTDDKGYFSIVSPSIRDILGYEPGEVLGKSVKDYYYLPEQHAALVAALRRGAELRNYEIQLRHQAGHPVSMLINSRLTPSGTEGIGRDVTEIRQIQDDLRHAKEEAEAALAAKTQFLANMSHELRTPMNGIIGMIDLLHQTGLGAEQADYVDTLRKSSDALLTILNDILDLSKIQAGKLRLQEAPLTLRGLLERLHSLFAYRASQKSLRFTYHITSHTPPYIITDEMRLLQILSNLVANALKFTAQGTVSVVVSSVATDGDYHTLRFAVQDSGIGISPDDAVRLFTSFTQLDTTPSKAFGGTGLGLAISKELAELLGGEIGVFSGVGEGSVFWFTIRCRVAAAPLVLPSGEGDDAKVAPPLALMLPVSGPAPRILLVDDNAINQKVAARLLDKLGCEVEIASDGYEAIARATALDATYQLILMDIQMPGLDGIAATSEIKARLGDICPPIIAMTAYSMPDDATRFVQAGLDDYLAKPVKHQQLSDMLARWLPEPPPTPAATNVIAATPAPVTLDTEVLNQLRQLGGHEFTADLYSDFELEAGELLKQAAACMGAANWEGLHPLMHQLKGTSATLGLVALAGQALRIEQLLKSATVAALPIEFKLLQHYFAQFKAVYPGVVTAPEPLPAPAESIS